MIKKLIISILTLFLLKANSQELLADVNVNFDQVQDANNVTYKALQKSLRDFINTTKWTDKKYKLHERIECSFLIIINSKEGTNQYNAQLSIQSRRPVFGSNYFSPVLNFQDKNFSFQYTDFEPLIFNERQFSRKNLTDVIAYYVYLILGYDADTFANEGGTDFYKKSLQIANNSVAQGYSGWAEIDGPRSRISLANDILNTQSKVLRNLSYQYHRLVLDQMANNPQQHKSNLIKYLQALEYYQKGNFNLFYPLDLFFFAKKEEILRIFSGGTPAVGNISKLKETLNSLSPINSETWNQLKN